MRKANARAKHRPSRVRRRQAEPEVAQDAAETVWQADLDPAPPEIARLEALLALPEHGQGAGSVRARQLLGVQRAVGNRATARLIDVGMRSPVAATRSAAGVVLRQPAAVVPLPAAPVPAAPVPAAPAAPKDPLADDGFVNTTINAFPNAVLKAQIGPGIGDRRDFLRGMQQYLGSLDDVIAHFKQIRTVAVPGDVNLHESAAVRLEKVAERLAGKMPATTVALGLRGRYRPHDRHSQSKMAHPCGYAIDYRAVENPMITDPRLVKLLELQTGGATHFDFGMSRSARRTLIEAMGEASAVGGIAPSSDLGKESQAFFATFDAQYASVSKASRDFTSALPATVTELKKLIQEQSEVAGEIQAKRKKQKKGKPPDPALAALEERKKEIAAKIAAIKADLPKLFEPWRTKIKEEMAKIQKTVPDVDLAKMPTKKSIVGSERAAGRQLRAAKQQKTKAASTVAQLERQIAAEQKRKTPRAATLTTLESKLTAARAALATKTEAETKAAEKARDVARLKEILPDKANWDVLGSLEKALAGDANFLFKGESTVKNPSVMQLVEKGFFTPDAEPDPGQAFNPNKHGFNLAFMKLMAEHGFDQGINWSPGSVDPMHFELVSGVDAIGTG